MTRRRPRRSTSTSTSPPREELRTEISREVHAASGWPSDLGAAGLELAELLTDADGLFALDAGAAARRLSAPRVGSAPMKIEGVQLW